MSDMNEPFKITHEYENSTPEGTKKILTVVNKKSTASKNEQFKWRKKLPQMPKKK